MKLEIRCFLTDEYCTVCELFGIERLSAGPDMLRDHDSPSQTLPTCNAGAVLLSAAMDAALEDMVGGNALLLWSALGFLHILS